MVALHLWSLSVHVSELWLKRLKTQGLFYLCAPPVLTSWKELTKQGEDHAHDNSFSCASARLSLPFAFPLPSSHCGQSLARLGAEVVGVDPSPENVAVASAHAKGDPLTRTIRYEATTAEELESRGAQNTAPVFLLIRLTECSDSAYRS